MKYGEVWRESAPDSNLFRYVVLLSPAAMIEDLESVITVPITSKKREWPTRVDIKLRGGARQVQCEGLANILKANLDKKVGELSLIEMAKIRLILKQIFSA